jgi:lipoprotein NlpD
MLTRCTGPFMLLVLLAGCSSQPVYAPVGARDNTQKPATKTPTARSTPAKTYRAPAGRPVARSTSGYHVVRRGETLYSIAWNYGLPYKQLAAINRIRPPYTIYAGQRLRTTSANQGRTTVAGADSKRKVARSSTTRKTTSAGPAPVKTPAAIAKPAPATTSSVANKSSAQAVEVAEVKLPDGVQQWLWPTRGKVLQGFQPDSPGKKGIDIGGRTGQSVMAAADGKVVYAGSGLVGYGRLIIIKHTESLLSAYGHNSELLVREGEHVKAGQTIAKMGNSGTDRTQLYFEIRKDGKPVNPLRYLPKA